MSNKITGGSGDIPVPQKARPAAQASSSFLDADAPCTTSKAPPPIAPGSTLGQGCPSTPPQAGHPQTPGSEPGQPCPASWGDYQAAWQPESDADDGGDWSDGWAWSGWDWNKWDGWTRKIWTAQSTGTIPDDPWGGTIDHIVEPDPGPSMSAVATASSLFEVSQPPEDSSGPPSPVSSGQGLPPDKTAESDSSESDSDDSEVPMGKPVSKMFGIMGKMKSTLMSPWAGTAAWFTEGQQGPVDDERPYSPTEPASSESDDEPAGPHHGQQGPTSPDYDPFAGPDGTWAGQTCPTWFLYFSILFYILL